MKASPVARRALVTGGTGYIGSKLVERLLADGWEVDVIVRSDAECEPLGALVEHIGVLVHDGSTASMLDLVTRARPDTVFHLATAFLAQHASEDVERLVTSNVLFPTQLAEAMLLAGCRRLVNVSTIWQHFGQAEYRPVNLYAATKQAFEDVVDYYADAHGFAAITVKLPDVYGPDDPRPKVVGLLCRAARNATPLDMSPGEQLLDLVFVDDVVSAMLLAADILAAQTGGHSRYCVSSGGAISLRQVAMTVEKVTGARLSINWGGRSYRPREVMRPVCPHPTIPGWRAKISLEQGLSRTLERL